jgi:hypothetical protein
MKSLFRHCACFAAALTALLASSNAIAQMPMGSSLAALGLARSSLDIETITGTQRLTGTSLTGDGRLSFWKLVLDVRYLEGELSDDASDITRRLIEAEALIGVRPIPWVALMFGPRVRKIATGPDSESSVFWTVRAQAEAALLEPFLFSYVGIWQMLFGNADNGSFDNGQGAEAGLVLKMESVPIWARFGYRIDRASFQNIARDETTQHLVVVVGLDVSP